MDADVKRKRGRPPSAPGARAAVQAQKSADEIAKLVDAGRMRAAAKELRRAVGWALAKGERHGRAGEAALRRVALVVLSKCIEFQVPPPAHLRDSLEVLLDVAPEDIGRHWEAVAFAAQFPSLNQVPTSGLARAADIDLKTARARKKDAEFHRKVETVKRRSTPAAQAEVARARNRAKAEAARTEALLNLVGNTAQRER